MGQRSGGSPVPGLREWHRPRWESCTAVSPRPTRGTTPTRGRRVGFSADTSGQRGRTEEGHVRGSRGLRKTAKEGESKACGPRDPAAGGRRRRCDAGGSPYVCAGANDGMSHARASANPGGALCERKPPTKRPIRNAIRSWGTPPRLTGSRAQAQSMYVPNMYEKAALTPLSPPQMGLRQKQNAERLNQTGLQALMAAPSNHMTPPPPTRGGQGVITPAAATDAGQDIACMLDVNALGEQIAWLPGMPGTLTASGRQFGSRRPGPPPACGRQSGSGRPGPPTASGRQSTSGMPTASGQQSGSGTPTASGRQPAQTLSPTASAAGQHLECGPGMMHELSGMHGFTRFPCEADRGNSELHPTPNIDGLLDLFKDWCANQSSDIVHQMQTDMDNASGIP
jgi:hypothetical protein